MFASRINNDVFAFRINNDMFAFRINNDMFNGEQLNQLLGGEKAVNIIASILREKEISLWILLNQFFLLLRRERQQALVIDLTIHTIRITFRLIDNHIVILGIHKNIGTKVWLRKH